MGKCRPHTVRTNVSSRRTLFSVRGFGPHRTSGRSDLVVGTKPRRGRSTQSRRYPGPSPLRMSGSLRIDPI